MLQQKIKKVLAVLLAICFMATVTAGTVSAHANENGHHIIIKPVTKTVKKPTTKTKL